MKDIDSAIKQLQESLASIPLDSADRPTTLNHQGEFYQRRFEKSGMLKDRDDAVLTFRSSSSPTGLLISRIQGALKWAQLAYLANDLASAAEGYDQAVRLLPQVAWIGLDAIAHLGQLTSDLQSLGCDAAACMIALAQSEPQNLQHHLGRAVEMVDQCPTILWSQTSDFKQDLEDLREVDSQLASELDLAGKALGQGCFRSPNDGLSEINARLYRRFAEKWEELVLRIRQLSGFQDFLLPPPISTLQTAAADGPVVIINFSRHRCDAIIFPPHGDLILFPLPDTMEELDTLISQQRELASQASVPADSSNTLVATPSVPLKQVLNQTWSLLGKPTMEKLEQVGLLGPETSLTSRVWWCLTGSLAFLPIHASFPLRVGDKQDVGMMDLVVSSYTPTISALLHARQPSPSPTFRMLAVGQSNVWAASPIHGVVEVIELIEHLLGPATEILQDSQATVDAVATALTKCSWAHSACHGVRDAVHAIDSGLVLFNGAGLALSRIAQSSLGSLQFAFLSSYQSAADKKAYPSELVHLAAGLQFAGFRGVIGTMWSAGDKDALIIAKHVYSKLFKDGAAQASASDASFALHQAVLQLRGDIPLHRWVPFAHFGL